MKTGVSFYSCLQFLPSGAHLGGQWPPRWAPEGREISHWVVVIDRLCTDILSLTVPLLGCCCYFPITHICIMCMRGFWSCVCTCSVFVCMIFPNPSSCPINITIHTFANWAWENINLLVQNFKTRLLANKNDILRLLTLRFEVHWRLLEKKSMYIRTEYEKIIINHIWCSIRLFFFSYFSPLIAIK